MQVVEEADEHKFGFDLLDATKLIPEEIVPVVKVDGRLIANGKPGPETLRLIRDYKELVNRTGEPI